MAPISVSELTSQIKAFLEPRFRSLQVRGEISNLKLQSSGHLYFSLKDAGSQISSVLFKGNAINLSKMPKEGDQVVAIGEISLYVPRGQYQLIVRELQFLGVGELLLKLHQLKETLQKRGWFAVERKRALPKMPKRIGVVTSPTGAVIQDILNVLTRRFSGLHIILNPVKVQGEGAKEEIARAIADFNRYEMADVLIVGRGGGSIEDLWAFNEELVAQAIFESKIPVISAVGHETDFTIADWVADVRAPTPSAAAEIVTAEKANLLKSLSQLESALKQRLFEQLTQGKKRLLDLQRHPLFSSPYALLAEPIQKIDSFHFDLDASIEKRLQFERVKLQAMHQRLELLKPSSKIAQLKERLLSYAERTRSSISQLTSKQRDAFERLSGHLLSIHPKNLLKKGYAVLFEEKSNTLIPSIESLQPNQKVSVLLHDGRVHATVNHTEAHVERTQ